MLENFFYTFYMSGIQRTPMIPLQLTASGYGHDEKEGQKLENYVTY